MLPHYDLISQDDGSYYFITKSGLTYVVVFQDYSQLVGFEFRVYELSFNPLNSTKDRAIGIDPLIGNTIIKVVIDFFDKNDDVLLFTCDSSDGKHLKRREYFKRLFNKANLKSILKKDTELFNGDNSEESKVIFASILVRVDNPQLDSILDCIQRNFDLFQGAKD